MRKILTLVIALTLTLSLAACSAVDKKGVADAYANVSGLYNEVANLGNQNANLISTETIAASTDIANSLEGYKKEIESSDLTQERADEIAKELAAYPDKIAELKTKLEEEISAGAAGVPSAGNSGAEISDEQLKALTEAYNAVAPAFNEMYEAAEANGWLADEQTNAEISVLNGALTGIGEALTNDLTQLNGSNFDELPGAVLDLMEGINEIYARVSVPYGAAGLVDEK